MTKSDYKNFTCFLKDEQFIIWQINPNDQLDKHWNDFISENPHLVGEIDKAARYLKNTVFANKVLFQPDNEKLLHSIETYINSNNRRKRKRRQLYISFISGAAIILLFVTLKVFDSTSLKSQVVKEEVIVGDVLNSIDIQLITSNETAFFNENLQMEFDDQGNAKISQTGNKEQKVIDLGNSKHNKLIVPYGKRSTLTLPDGSKLWLNSGSVLEFPTQFEKDIREITLESGELYIEVASDKKRPFFVMTSSIKIEVTGTKFNVTNYADSPKSVVLVEGQVSVHTDKQNKRKLVPNEQAVLNNNGIFETQLVDVNQFISWKNGYLFFEEASMSEVLHRIEKYYNISFNYDKDISLKEQTCSGRIVLSENIDNVMTTIALLTSTKYKKIDNNIYISYKTE